MSSTHVFARPLDVTNSPNSHFRTHQPIQHHQHQHHQRPQQFSSLDANSTNPLGGGSPMNTRSINPSSHSLVSFPPSATSPHRAVGPAHWHQPTVAIASPHKTIGFEIPVNSAPLTKAHVGPSNLSAGLAAVAQAQAQAKLDHSSSSVIPPPSTTLTASTTAPTNASTPMMSLQRHNSEPSSCGSGSLTSMSPIGTPFTSAAPSPTNGMNHTNSSVSPSSSSLSLDSLPTRAANGSLVDQPPPDPVSLWFGCEDAVHARVVLAEYASLLSVTTQRVGNMRAPLEFIGRVKRERLDLAKLHRLVEQHLALKRRAGARQRFASAADSNASGYELKKRRTSASSPCLSRFDSTDFLGTSPSPSSAHFVSPLHSLPPRNAAFATLDLVSIYSRDTLPLGLVFPLIRHEWVVTVWNIWDGVPESQRRIHVEYEEIEGEEDEPDEEDQEAIAALELYTKAVVRSPKVGLNPSSSTSSSCQASPQLTSTNLLNATISSSSSSSSSANTAAISSSSSSSALVSSSSRLWHLDAASTTSVSESPSTSSSVTPIVEPTPNTSFLYNLPIFSQDATGEYNTFGCRIVRPLGEFGKARNKTASKDKKKKGKKLLNEPLPSSLGYSGAQNDCIMYCLQALGRKVKCNGVGSNDDAAGEAACLKLPVTSEEGESKDSSQSNPRPSDESSDSQFATESDSDSSESDGSDTDTDLSDSDSDDDGAKLAASDDLDDVGFEFGAESDEDHHRPRTSRHHSSSKAVSIQKQSSSTSARFGRADHSSDDDDDDDDFSDDGMGQSFSQSMSSPIAAGSLGDELQAQLMSLGLKGGSKPPSSRAR